MIEKSARYIALDFSRCPHRFIDNDSHKFEPQPLKPTSMTVDITKTQQIFIKDIVRLVADSKQQLAITVNSHITYLYWQIGYKINHHILGNKRANYGKKIVIELSKYLLEHFGKGFDEKNLRRMMQFAHIFDKEEIVVSLIRQLSWTHFLAIIPIKDDLKRQFYTQMCRMEGWSVRILRSKIDSMLYERTAISKKPDALIKEELTLLEKDEITPDLVFKDPYFLDFTGLKDSYSEKSLEDSILQELESFMLELGSGFSFVQRQKRMVIDDEDFYLDLLFYHRKLRRLVAVELKIGKFKAAYKGQMELYLRWLEKYEKNDHEESPIGLILCAEGNNEQIELLQIEKSGINVAKYLTDLPDKKLLENKLHQIIKANKERYSK